uniref:A_deaminase domain-containing protein n=1 Tax=Globodera pallida TaxID=36090 RepID=A0A183BKD8_GLOPA
MIGSGSFSGHLISSPYELSQYPIEIQETKSALQRQISNRLAEVNSMSSATLSRQEPQNDRPNSSLDQATSSLSSSLSTGHQQHNPTGRRWSLQPPPTHQQPQHQQFRLESIRERKAFEAAAAATSGTASPVPANSPATPTTLNGGTAQPMPMSPIGSSPRGEQLHDIDRVLCSAQHVEMRTFRDAIDVNYQRMGLNGEELSGVPLEDLRTAARSLVEALRLRSEYMERIAGYFPSTTRNFLTGKYPCELPKLRQKNSEASATMSYNPPEPPLDHWGLDEPLPVFERKFALCRRNGIVVMMENEKDEQIVEELKHSFITRDKFLKDYTWLNRICNEGPLKTFCYRRLTFLQTHFSLHVLLNDQLENAEQRSVPHRDFYNIRKVDTHIHAASSMNHKHLLRFIKKKMRTDADEVVQEKKDGTKVTMSQLFQQMDIRPYDLSVDMLDVHADRHT